jgi:hypothetical protein
MISRLDTKHNNESISLARSADRCRPDRGKEKTPTPTINWANRLQEGCKQHAKLGDCKDQPRKPSLNRVSRSSAIQKCYLKTRKRKKTIYFHYAYRINCYPSGSAMAGRLVEESGKPWIRGVCVNTWHCGMVESAKWILPGITSLCCALCSLWTRHPTQAHSFPHWHVVPSEQSPGSPTGYSRV